MSEKPKLSRAEIVRQRRTEQNTQRLRQADERAHKPRPRVTTRETPYVALHDQSEKGPRRFHMVMAMPRVGLEVPSRMAPPRVGWRALSFTLMLVFGFAIYFALTSTFFRVSNALVTGNVRLSREEINSVLGAAGQPIFLMRPNDLTMRLRLNFPELASAEVKVYFPNQVWVGVAERTPIILWQEGEGYTWLDASGIAFRPRGPLPPLISVLALSAPPGGLPILDDPLSPPPYLAKDLVDAVQALAPSVPAGTMMIYDAHNGLGWKDDRGWQASFGSAPNDIALKLRIYQTLVDSLTARGIYPEFISVAYADAPFYRMAEGTGECSADTVQCFDTSEP